MKMHRIQRTVATILPALLTLWLAPVAPAGTNGSAADFSFTIPFELGEGEFAAGDSITIERVRGTSATIHTGETYCVEGIEGAGRPGLVCHDREQGFHAD